MPNRRADLLVVRNDRLGDALLALPVVGILKDCLPDRRLHFWASKAVAPLIKCVEGIDTVIAGSDRSGRSAIEALRSLPIGTAWCLRPTFHNAWALMRAGIPIRVGTSRRWYSLLFTHRVNLPRRGKRLHEADLNIELLTATDQSGRPRFPKFVLPDESISRADRILRDVGVLEGGLLVVVHPGSGGSSRRWPSRYFKQVADVMQSQVGAWVVVIGTKGEESLCSAVAGSGYANLCGLTGILELTSIISRADLVIANSSGPLHLAVALERKVIGLYPPVPDCLPERWGPYGHPDWALKPELPLCRRCRPGEFSPCACMEQLQPERVINLALELIEP